jgi:hypothetical protein
MGSSSSKLLAGLLCTLSISCPVPAGPAAGSATWAFQPLPFSSSDRWIVDANGDNVPVVGINWPGAADTMLPEGLGYQSIANIVQKLTDTGFNTVRLTFAIEMVDDILDNGGDVTLSATLTNALGPTNGTAMLAKIVNNNPQFNANTTRLQVGIFPSILRKKKSKMLNGVEGFRCSSCGSGSSTYLCPPRQPCLKSNVVLQLNRRKLLVW